jgi:hypothetical protein
MFSNNPKKQHYVPQFYLKGFTKKNSSTLFLFDKEKQEIRSQNIKDICSQNYLYSYKDKNGYNFTVEKELSKHESDYSQVLTDVVNFTSGINQRFPCRNTRQIFLEFIYNLIIRSIRENNRLDFLVGTGFARINEIQGIKQNSDEILNDVKKMTYEKWFIDNDRKDELISILKIKKWIFWVISDVVDASFVSSDNPVMITNPDRDSRLRGLVHPLTEISTPLNNKIVLTLFEKADYKYEIKKVTSIEEVHRMNALFIQSGTRFIYSGIREMLE